jgi:two-component system nitrogen regulation sensor histidine kinase GlnL
MNHSPPVVETADKDLFSDAMRLLNALPQPVMAIDAGGRIREVNAAAEHFFDMGRATLQRSRLLDLMPFGSPVLDLVDEAMSAEAPINGYKLEVSG